MKSTRKTRAKKQKTTYFRKDYAPARYLAEQKRANTFSGKVSKTVKKAATSVKKSAKSTATKAAKSLRQAAAKSRSKSQKSPAYNSPRAAASPKNSAQLTARYTHTSSRPSRYTRKSPKPSRFTWREASLVSMIGACALMIAITLIFSHVYDPVKRSQAELEKLAYDYYTEYLYPYSLGRNLEHPEVILADYVYQGLPAVRLRQLLLYNNGSHASSAEVFSNQYYECDKNQTYVRYYPVEPFGPSDFTITYGTACEKISSVN